MRQRNTLHAFLRLLIVFTFAIPLSGTTDCTVNINTASAEALADCLVGVGPAKAQAIIEERDRNGPFRTPEELQRVSGIGPATVEENRD